MKIGFMGLGKLGFPVALTMALKGHHVKGYDPVKPPNPWPHQEQGIDGGDINDYDLSKVEVATLPEVVEHAEILFIAVQTPNSPECEGITHDPPLEDFNTSYLREAWDEAQALVFKPTKVVVISTVLPGTCDSLPKDNPHVQFAYNPHFIAMGTVMHDVVHPEFVLNGGVDLSTFYATITTAPVIRMGIESAELTKVAYNTFIGMKIAFANLLGEMCYRSEANVDEVTHCLAQATDRLISAKYLTAGMGDGGGCHPRDNIALAWWAEEYGLHHNLFQDIIYCREDHARFLANLMRSEGNHLPSMILGTAFKPQTNIKTGSHALLVQDFLGDCLLADHYTVRTPYVILIGCKRPEYAKLKFAGGSVVIDPFRYIPKQDGVRVIPIG